MSEKHSSYFFKTHELKTRLPAYEISKLILG